MLIKIMYCLWLPLAAWNATANGDGYRFENNEVELGEVSPSSFVKGTFAFTNTSDQTVTVSTVQAPPECEVITSLPMTVPAGEVGRIVFESRTPASGDFHQVLGVTLVAAKAEGQVLQAVHIRGTVKQTLTVEPEGFRVHLMKDGKTPELRFSLKGEAADYALKQIRTDEQFLTVRRIDDGTHQLDFKQDIYRRAGTSFRLLVEIEYNALGKSFRRMLPVYVQVDNPCEIEPDIFSFGKIRASAGPIIRGYLAFEADDFSITGISKAPDYLQVKYARYTGENRYLLLIKMQNPPPTKDHFEDEIVLETKNKHYPVRISVAGRVLD